MLGTAHESPAARDLSPQAGVHRRRVKVVVIIVGLAKLSKRTTTFTRNCLSA